MGQNPAPERQGTVRPAGRQELFFSSRQTLPRRACAHGRARTLALFHDFPGEPVYRSAPGKLSMRLKSLLDNHFQLPRILPEHRCQLRDSMTHLSLYVRLCKDTRRDGFTQTIELVWPEQDQGKSGLHGLRSGRCRVVSGRFSVELARFYPPFGCRKGRRAFRIEWAEVSSQVMVGKGLVSPGRVIEGDECSARHGKWQVLPQRNSFVAKQLWIEMAG